MSVCVGARRSFADRIKPRATCLITSHHHAGVFHTTLHEKPTHETYLPLLSFLPSYRLALFVSLKSEAREFRSKIRFVVRKARAWPNLMLASVEQMSPDIKQSKKQIRITWNSLVIGEHGDVLGVASCDTWDNYIAQGMPLDSKRCTHDWFRYRSVFTMTDNVTARIFQILAREKIKRAK